MLYIFSYNISDFHQRKPKDVVSLPFPGIEPVIHHPHSHNVILPVSVLENTGRDYYSMGELWTREALIIGREPFENMYII